MRTYAEALQQRLNQPFQRRQTFSESEQEALDRALKFKKDVIETLKTLGEFTEEFDRIHEKVKPLAPPTFTVHQTAAVTQNGPQCICRCLGPTCEGKLPEELVQKATDVFAMRWKLKDEMSEVAFKGMLLVLEHCLGSELQNHESFQHFVKALGFHTVFFWKKAVPIIYNSDFQYGTNYRETLLFSLALYDVNEGHNRLRELFAAVPGLRDSLMGKHAKRFEESFHHLLQRRSSFCSTSNSCQASEADAEETPNSEELEDDICGSSDNSGGTGGKVTENDGEESEEDAELAEIASEKESVVQNGDIGGWRADILGSVRSSVGGDGSVEPPETIVGGGLASGHFQERVINVSNAPPVSLKKNVTGEWQIGQGSGGLVSCCDPVMNKDPDNVWLACFGPSARLGAESPCPTATNSLGLPIIQKTSPSIRIDILQDPKMKEDDDIKNEIRDQMSLVGVLKNYNRDNYNLNPVIVPEEDYNTYYGGISNGLLWPAFHNLAEYIVKDYDTVEVLMEHWYAYVRVNYQFAINAVRNSREQDFIWIHDYHLILTGLIMQSLDPNVEVGFFLHIPFQPPEEFFTKYKLVAEAVLRGIIRFTKVGFQTHRDRQSFLDLVGQHLTNAKVKYIEKMDVYTVTHEGWTSSIGVFPVSIKNEEFLTIVHDPEVQKYAEELRESVKEHCLPGGKFFFSVERFDYTKGIKEKLEGYRNYLEKHPDRWGKDVLLQVAVINRRSVETYRQYQDECTELAERINADFKSEESPEWCPLIFQTDGLQRPKLVAHYLAMDVGVVTPKKDGMNLVAKEMLICNPKASLMISSGAGTEQQLSAAGFYTEQFKCYHRVLDVYDAANYGDVFYEAAIEDPEVALENGHKLRNFLMANDIEKWSTTFLDPSWAHDVIRPTEINTLTEFYSLMMQTKNVRRQIVERVLKGFCIRLHFGISLKNAKESLEKSCLPDSRTIVLKASDQPGARQKAKLDISDEIQELEKDLAFLDFIQSQDYDNVEQFLQTLEKFHPESADVFHREIDETITLLSRGDHFQHFFTDRDGTLKSYSCSYSSSIQPSYSGVIQATFAHRCTQYAAILTSAPLMNTGILDVQVMPDGYFCYGASGGTEWYIDASKKFKDDSISDSDLALLDVLHDRLRSLLESPEFHHFTWVGSGIQKHYGHLTVARQDIYGSIDETQSANWLQAVSDLVHSVDTDGKILQVSDNELDIKVYVKAKMSGNIFNKGHGIRLLAQKMSFDLKEGNILVCGDTETDLEMLHECLKINPEDTFTVWVTRNEELRQKVEEICAEVGNKNFAFVSCPEVILGAMSQATIREIKRRPTATGGLDVDYCHSAPCQETRY